MNCVEFAAASREPLPSSPSRRPSLWRGRCGGGGGRGGPLLSSRSRGLCLSPQFVVKPADPAIGDRGDDDVFWLASLLRHAVGQLGPVRIEAPESAGGPIRPGPSAVRDCRRADQSRIRLPGASRWTRSAASRRKTVPVACRCRNGRTDRPRPAVSPPSPSRLPARSEPLDDGIVLDQRDEYVVRRLEFESRATLTLQRDLP